MKNLRYVILFFTLFFQSAMGVSAETNWPKEIPLDSGGKITIYQLQPESLLGPNLKSRAAISVKQSSKSEPVFGVFWSECYLATDRNSRMATLESIKITEVKFPDLQDTSKINSLKRTVETEMVKWHLEISLDEIAATLDEEKKATDDKLNTAPPKIIYSNKIATLILIDGEPIVKKDDQMNMERVNNTPYLIIKSPEDKKFYLYGDKIWYSSSSPKDNYSVAQKLPESIKNVDEQIQLKIKENNDTNKAPTPPPLIIISTDPAELISSDGEAKFASVEGTGLLYMSNTNDEVFMDVSSQQYFVLLSGRWYKSASLNGPWTYTESDKLPPDFSKIPEGSEKDVVLASVAGTDASKDAIMDAQIPQTAKVDRKTATASVTYDGEPKFENIEGTNIDLAVNTSSTVMRSNGKYYCLEKGIWFASEKPTGPWTVSDERPAEVDKIPASNPAYNTKYVYVYESSPEVVYVGYTPGYMGCYVYGPTVVYGTGYYYSPWYGMYYYPRPVTYGFGFYYNPWIGWSIGFGVNYGMVHMSYYGWGWYGCGGYHPPYGYHGGYYGGHHGGYYGPRGGNYYGSRNTNININNSNNIYRNNNSVSTRPSRPQTGDRQNMNRTSTKPGTSDNINKARSSTKTPNNVYSDKQGNIYQNKSKGKWQQRNDGSWKSSSPSKNPTMNQMQREQQNRSRSNTNYNNSQRYNNPSPQRSAPAQRSTPGSGGGRRK